MDRQAEMARSDALTDARNRHNLSNEIDAFWAEWQRRQTEFAFLSIEIDFCKKVNDVHGHDVSDAVLRTVVRRLDLVMWVRDRILRMGGEEFRVLMRVTSTRDAIAVSQRLRLAICAAPFVLGAITLPIPVNLGNAGVMAQDASFDDLLKRADQAMYHTKHTGRNRLISAFEGDLATA